VSCRAVSHSVTLRYQVKQQTNFIERMACACWHGEKAPTVSICSDRHDAMILFFCLCGCYVFAMCLFNRCALAEAS